MWIGNTLETKVLYVWVDHDKPIDNFTLIKMNSAIFIIGCNSKFIGSHIGYIQYRYVSFAFKSIKRQCIDIHINTLQQFLQEFLMLLISSNFIILWRS